MSIPRAQSHFEETKALRAEEIALRLVSWPSETGTPGEADFADRFVALLAEFPYFRDNPDAVRLIDSHGDPMTRSVLATVRGTGSSALALVGHYDTVSTDNFQDLQPLACDSRSLRDALVSEFSSRERSAQEQRALQDLQSGLFLPGRGMLDMKSGIAAGLACLEQFSQDSNRQGNLMLIITPDEERESRGMRSLRDALPEVMQDLGLTLDAAINMDVTSDQGNGEAGRAAYAGTIGKLLPFALIIGQGAHVSYPFEGISAAAMASAVLARVEGNAALADDGPDDIAPPPICLEAKDLRNGYEVTTPERFWLAFNWLYCTMDAQALFKRFCDEVAAGATQAMSQFAQHAATFSAQAKIPLPEMASTPHIMRVEELTQLARVKLGERFEALYAAEQKVTADVDNPLFVSRHLAEWLVNSAQVKGPTIIVGFAGLHYPATRLDSTSAADIALRDAVDAARADLGGAEDREVVWRPYFQGVSDMSFLGQPSVQDTITSRNTPIARLVDHPSEHALRFPAINIGPWGREFHQKLERVHAPYAFSVLPELISKIVRHYFTNSTSRD